MKHLLTARGWDQNPELQILLKCSQPTLSKCLLSYGLQFLDFTKSKVESSFQIGKLANTNLRLAIGE